ncbi:MAG TPA: BlaI/MecI/CopY family transcriptional regulator [Ruania sp.]|nr:BlaI/MecI/CopY family transcriptional regulator [Ruania sp.]
MEAKVMDALWDEAGLSVRELIERLGGTSAYTTIATVLSNLSRKELVVAERSGHSTRYHPALSRAEHTAAVMGYALAASKDREASILHFVETMPPDDLELLRAYLDRHEQQAES